MSESGHGSAPMVSPPVSSTQKVSPRNWFTTEILQMMHGFGDCRRPLQESAALVEQIVHQQITQVVYQAAEVAQQRNARYLGMEDFLFLMRRDKVKLRRLLHYLDMKDQKALALKGLAGEEEEPADIADAKQQPPMKKRRKQCQDFLSSIDHTGELVGLFDDTFVDEVKHERALRAELQSRKMDHQQYIDFCQARQTSFCRRYKSQKFRDWALHTAKLDIKPNQFAIEVLSYLAYETVGQIVDLALLVKRDLAASADDPFKQMMPGVCISHSTPPPPMPPPTTPTTPVLKSPGVKLTSPVSRSPPATPTSSGATTSTSTVGILTATSSASVSGQSKSKSSKKKKKGGPIMMMEMPQETAIQPSDIREAMRRYGTAVGPFSPFTKKPPPISPKQRLICC